MNSLNRFSRESVKEGFKAVKGDALDAFVYDATVLEYLVGQDDECNVLMLMNVCSDDIPLLFLFTCIY